MPDEDIDLPQALREGISAAYLECISGDAWTRVSNTGALLTLLTAAIELSKNDEDRKTLFKAIETWNASVDDVSIEITQPEAVRKAAQIARAVSKMIFRYGKFSSNWFSAGKGERK